MPAPVVAAAGLTAGAGLLQALLQQKQQEEMYRRQQADAARAAELQRAFQQEQSSQAATRGAERDLMQSAGAAGDREIAAIDRVINAIARTVR
jgi:hypothetical protein